MSELNPQKHQLLNPIIRTLKESEAAPVQYVEDFPTLLHSTAGSGVLSNGRNGAQNGGSILSLQSTAAHNHHWTLSS